ncbi:hypothetical protein PR048_018409 [Dryococelus australis]|uniref:Reverse transcriptase/retrotransposon-derived protein RNase H-like domain-containing protein n=1 Tax=Dryococelus australis TaxID=614101 RepID=A0ABQ9HC84_9NEOP|nr:hypothetical protein PR048_018409 [Dryococelus australis]
MIRRHGTDVKMMCGTDFELISNVIRKDYISRCGDADRIHNEARDEATGGKELAANCKATGDDETVYATDSVMGKRQSTFVLGDAVVMELKAITCKLEQFIAMCLLKPVQAQRVFQKRDVFQSVEKVSEFSSGKAVASGKVEDGCSRPPLQRHNGEGGTGRSDKPTNVVPEHCLHLRRGKRVGKKKRKGGETQEEQMKQGCTDKISHCIETGGDAKPKYVRPYHVSQSQKESLKEQIQIILDAEVIVPSLSLWSAPIILIIQKAANGFNICPVIDFHALNQTMKILCTLYPSLMIDMLGGAKYTISLPWIVLVGFGKFTVIPEDQEKTGFSTPDGHYHCLFDRPNFFVYLDDIVFSKTEEEHIQNLKLVFEILRSAILKLKQEFIGFVEYYSWLIPNFSKVAQPLTELTKKDAFEWIEEREHAFSELREALCSKPILRYPDFSLPCYVICNSSGTVTSGSIVSKS